MLGNLARASAGGAALLASLTLLASCRDDLARFDTGSTDAYCGTLTAPFVEDGFLPNGVPFGTLRVRLELQTSALRGRPGRLWSNDGAQGLCSPQPLLNGAELRAISALEHDALERLSLGDGHVQDFFAWVDTTCQGTLVAIVSLLENGEVELRLLKPMADSAADAPPHERPGFALFRLQKFGDRCGF